MTHLGHTEYTSGYVDSYGVRLEVFYSEKEKAFVLETHETSREDVYTTQQDYRLVYTRLVPFYDFSSVVLVPHGEVRGCRGGNVCLCNRHDEHVRGLMNAFAAGLAVGIARGESVVKDLQGLIKSYVLV